MKSFCYSCNSLVPITVLFLIKTVFFTIDLSLPFLRKLNISTDSPQRYKNFPAFFFLFSHSATLSRSLIYSTFKPSLVIPRLAIYPIFSENSNVRIPRELEITRTIKNTGEKEINKQRIKKKMNNLAVPNDEFKLDRSSHEGRNEFGTWPRNCWKTVARL